MSLRAPPSSISRVLGFAPVHQLTARHFKRALLALVAENLRPGARRSRESDARHDVGSRQLGLRDHARRDRHGDEQDQPGRGPHRCRRHRRRRDRHDMGSTLGAGPQGAGGAGRGDTVSSADAMARAVAVAVRDAPPEGASPWPHLVPRRGGGPLGHSDDLADCPSDPAIGSYPGGERGRRLLTLEWGLLPGRDTDCGEKITFSC